MDKLRVGFIGVGRIADLHHLGYEDNPKAELYAVCDTDQGLLERRASEWGVERAYSDYRQLLADSNVDAVEVITPHDLHAEMCIAALQAGKHVSVQKPMAMNLTEADAVIGAATRSDTLFRVIENFRYYPPYNKAKEIIDSGEIGEPLSIRMKTISGNARYGWEIPPAAREWRLDPARSGDGPIVFDHGHHIWSLAMYLIGEVERVFAFIGRTELRPGHFLDSPAMVTWKYANLDKYGSWEAVNSEDLMVPSKYAPIDVWLEITGSRGLLWVNHCQARTLDRPPLEMYRDGVMTGFSNIDSDYATSFVKGVDDFVDAVLAGREPELTGREAREVLRLSLAIQLSAKERREVQLDEITD